MVNKPTLLLFLLSPLLFLGCGKNSDVVAPSPAPQFQSQIDIETVWTARVGEGVGDVFLSLKPAVTERWVYAAALPGQVKKFDRESGKVMWSINLKREITGGVTAGYGVVALASPRRTSNWKSRGSRSKRRVACND